MSGMGYLALGFGAVWVLVAVYLVWLGHRQTQIRRRLQELQAHGREPDA